MGCQARRYGGYRRCWWRSGNDGRAVRLRHGVARHRHRRGSEKGDVVKKLGAQSYIDFTTTKNLVADVKAASSDGLGPSAALLLAVQEKPFQQATQYVRSRGVVVCIGLPANAKLSADVFDTVTRMINIRGSYVGNRADTAEAIDFFRRGLIKVPFKTVGLSKLQDVYKLMEEGKIAGRYVVDTSK